MGPKLHVSRHIFKLIDGFKKFCSIDKMAPPDPIILTVSYCINSVYNGLLNGTLFVVRFLIQWRQFVDNPIQASFFKLKFKIFIFMKDDHMLYEKLRGLKRKNPAP